MHLQTFVDISIYIYIYETIFVQITYLNMHTTCRQLILMFSIQQILFIGSALGKHGN